MSKFVKFSIAIAESHSEPVSSLAKTETNSISNQVSQIKFPVVLYSKPIFFFIFDLFLFDFLQLVFALNTMKLVALFGLLLLPLFDELC